MLLDGSATAALTPMLASVRAGASRGRASIGGHASSVQNFLRKAPNHVGVAGIRVAERHPALAGLIGLGRPLATPAGASDVTRGSVLILHNGVDHAHRYPHLLGELKSLGAEARLARLSSVEIAADGSLLMKGRPTAMPDAIIARPISERDLALLQRLEQRGVFVVDSPGALEAANSKAELARAFQSAGVASPETVVVTSRSQMDDAAVALGLDDGLPVVLKTDKDSGGKGVWLARNRAEYEALAPRVMKLADERGEPAIVQRFEQIVSEPGAAPGAGIDRRVLVMRDPDGTPRAFAGYRRVARGTDFRANGGELGNVYTRLDPSGASPGLTAQELRLAEQAVAATGVDYAGVDIMRTAKGPLAIEINPTPGTPELDLWLPRDEHAMPRLARWTVHGSRPT